MKQIRVVACSYALTPQQLQQQLARLGAGLGVKFAGVLVANRAAGTGFAHPDWVVLQGSNASYDFSAYQEGLDHLLQTDPSLPPVVLFLNDSLLQSHHARANMRAVLQQLPLLQQVEVPAIAGRTDRYAMLCHANPWNALPLYVSTYCFALNQHAWPMLRALQEQARADGLTDDVSILDPRWAAGMPANFRAYVRAFLCYEDTWFSWPGRDRYARGGSQQALTLAVKARCIYMEHRLSGEVGRVGCIVPINARMLDRWRLNLAEKAAAAWRALCGRRV